MKNFLLLIAFQLVCGLTFAQDPVPSPLPEPTGSGPKVDIHQVVDEPAEYQGGNAVLQKFFADNLKYPESAKENGIEGKSYIEFVVTETGAVTQPKVKKGMPECKECDKEAIRLVLLTTNKWKPGKIAGKPVKSYYIVPVKFILN